MPKVTDKEKVEDYMQKLEHPFIAEINALRSIIVNANSKLSERIKWNAPSYYYINDMAAFNLRAKGYVQLIFVFYNGDMIQESMGLLEGKWVDRREARFYSMDDVIAKSKALEKVVNDWVALVEKETI
ncbi:protein of unknown function (DU1801) [Solitalea canadensis DSM 3403]|uniref:YdhG-like domain-containing protein n=2 Tax=Solitalea canadensis TaxID=995 RepID=H8KLV7_SOLCM|nr:protein of unknown function (DU1801) [Solitalea canadensis DSM 3403]